MFDTSACVDLIFLFVTQVDLEGKGGRTTPVFSSSLFESLSSLSFSVSVSLSVSHFFFFFFFFKVHIF